jgi:hypothetical protein
MVINMYTVGPFQTKLKSNNMYGTYNEEDFDCRPNFIRDCLDTYSQQKSIQRMIFNEKFLTNRIYLAQPVIKKSTIVQIDSEDYSNRATKQIIQLLFPPGPTNQSIITICIEREQVEEEEIEDDEDIAETVLPEIKQKGISRTFEKEGLVSVEQAIKNERAIKKERSRTPSPLRFRLPSHPANATQKRTQSTAELTPERERAARRQQDMEEEDTEQEDIPVEDEIGELEKSNETLQTSSVPKKKRGRPRKDKEAKHLAKQPRATRSGRVPIRSNRNNTTESG